MGVFGRLVPAAAGVIALWFLFPLSAAAQTLPFRADLTVVWDQFRHGGGLNDVVVNPNLPISLSWRFEGPRKGTSTSPVVAGSSVLIASNDRSLYALDAATGKQRWQWKGDNEVMSAPVYRDGMAFVGTGDADSPVWDPPVYNIVGMHANDLNAVDLRTGRTVWSFGLTGSGMPMPALFGKNLLHLDGSGVLLALDARTGTYLWRRLFYSNFSMTNVLLSGGLAYFGGRFPNAVYAVSARDGQIAWQHGFSRRDGAFDDCPLSTDGRQIFGMYSRPLDSDPKRFIVAGRRARQHVYALDARTGRLRWDAALTVTGDEPPYNESAIPMYAGTTVYDGSPLAPVVTALDARTGIQRWTVRVSGPVKGGFALRDGVLYFGDLAGRLWAVDAARGRILGSVQTDLKFNVGSPIVLNGSLIVGSADGPVIAVPLDAIRASRSIAGVTTTSSGWLRWMMLIVALLAAAAAVQAMRRRRTRMPR